MTDDSKPDATAENKAPQGQSNLWHYQPPLPMEEAPLFVWPPKLVAAGKYMVSNGYLISFLLPYGTLAALTWFFLQPGFDQTVTLSWDWIGLMLLRNALFMAVIAHALHLYLYTFRKQGDEMRYDTRDLEEDNPKFFTRRQTRDNIFWTMVFCVPIWTAYEVLFMWLYANGWAPFYLNPMDHPILFVATFILIPFYQSFLFYFMHRFLHWKPIFPYVHMVHHRNDNTGPWSGMAMHPIEHIVLFSSVFIHLILPSHPMHVLFHMQFHTLTGPTSHAGYEALMFKKSPVFALGSFHHQLHHRFFNCNFGNRYVPCDKWFGTNHDGTRESWLELKRRWKEKKLNAR